MLRKLYDWTLEKAAHPHAVWWLAMFAFIEASFFPVPPHPLLGLMCLAEPKKAVRFAAVATVASVAGGLLGYAIGWGLYDTIGQDLLRWLGLTESFPVAACYLKEYGVEILIVKGAIVSRSISFMIVGVLFRMFGAPIKRFIDKYLGLVTIGFVAIVVLGFVAVAYLDSGEDAATAEKCSGATLEQLHS